MLPLPDMTCHAREMKLASLVGAAVLIGSACICPTLAQSPTPSPSPNPEPSDPCTPLIAIVTRPTITTSVCTVRPGHVLIENGYTNTVTTGTGGGVTINYPQSLVRVGVAQHMEISFAPPSFERSSLGGAIASGSSDMGIGAKWELGYTDSSSWGAGFFITGATGDPAFTAGATQYSGLLNWTYTLDPTFGLSGTVSFNSLAAANAAGQYQQYSAIIPSFVLTASLPGQPSQLFAEYTYYSHAGPGLDNRGLFDFGYVRDFGPRVQFDIEYGTQSPLLNGGPTHYFGAGLSLMN